MQISNELKDVLDQCTPTATERMPQGVKATAENYIRLAEDALQLLRKFPPEMPVSIGTLIDISLPSNAFRELFAGRDVTIRRDDCIVEMFVYWRYIQIRCMDYEEVKVIIKKRDVMRLPAIEVPHA